MSEIERLQKENAELRQLLENYYYTTLIGAQMEDPTPYEVRDYGDTMKSLQARTEQLLPVTVVTS